MLSLEDYNALSETAYILSNPSNTKHVLSSLEELRAGKGQVRELIKFEF